MRKDCDSCCLCQEPEGQLTAPNGIFLDHSSLSEGL